MTRRLSVQMRATRRELSNLPLSPGRAFPWAKDRAFYSPSRPSSLCASFSSAAPDLPSLLIRFATRSAVDTLAWFKSRPQDRQSKLHAGLTPEREAEVLATWKKQKG